MELIKKYELWIWILTILLVFKCTTLKKWHRYQELVKKPILKKPQNTLKAWSLQTISEKAKKQLEAKHATLVKSEVRSQSMIIEMVTLNPLDTLKDLTLFLHPYSLEIDTLKLTASENCACMTVVCSKKSLPPRKDSHEAL